MTSLADSATYVRHAPLPLAAGLSFLFGALGFFSPCVLPLVPGYLSYLASLVGASDADAKADRSLQRRALCGVALFVLGFSTLFAAEGSLLGVVGAVLRDRAIDLQRAFGLLVTAMGLVYVGGMPMSQGAVGVRLRAGLGLAGAPIVGAAFGLAWGPCLTPVASAVLSLAYDQSAAGRGAVLMLFYGLGLGVPFIAAAAGVGWLVGTATFVRRHRAVFRYAGGAMLVSLGVALVTGMWNHWADWLRAMAA